MDTNPRIIEMGGKRYTLSRLAPEDREAAQQKMIEEVVNGILAESSRKEAQKLDPSLGLPGPEKYGMGDDILEAALNSRGRKLVSLSGDHGPSQEELYRRDVMSEDSLKAGE